MTHRRDTGNVLPFHRAVIGTEEFVVGEDEMTPGGAVVLLERIKKAHEEYVAGSRGEIVLPKIERALIMGQGDKDYTFIVPVTTELVASLPLKESVTVSIGGEDFLFKRKKEFHITALGFGTRALVREKLAAYESTKGGDAVAMFNKILSEIDFSFAVKTGEVLMIHNLDYNAEAVRTKTGSAAFESERTIVVGVELPGVAELYRRLKETFDLDLGVPATHITLYLPDQGDRTGLGIAITDFQAQVDGAKFPHIAVEPMTIAALT